MPGLRCHGVATRYQYKSDLPKLVLLRVCGVAWVTVDNELILIESIIFFGVFPVFKGPYLFYIYSAIKSIRNLIRFYN